MECGEHNEGVPPASYIDGAMPRVTFVDGGPGIARRIAFLTRGQTFARTAGDFALFTRNDSAIAALAPALALRGLLRSATL